MNNITIRKKLFMLSASFFAPIAVLSFLLITLTNKDISFAAKELVGTDYFDAQQSLLIAALGYSGAAEDKAALEGALQKTRALEEVNADAMQAGEAARDKAYPVDSGSPTCSM